MLHYDFYKPESLKRLYNRYLKFLLYCSSKKMIEKLFVLLKFIYPYVYVPDGFAFDRSCTSHSSRATSEVVFATGTPALLKASTFEA